MLLFLLLLLSLHRPLPFLIIRSDRAAKPRPVHVAPHPYSLLCPSHFSMCPHWSFVVPQFWPQFNFLVMHIAAAVATPILFIRHAHSRTIQPFPSLPCSAVPCKPIVPTAWLNVSHPAAATAAWLLQRPQCNQRNRWNRLKSVRARCIYRRFV